MLKDVILEKWKEAFKANLIENIENYNKFLNII